MLTKLHNANKNLYIERHVDTETYLEKDGKKLFFYVKLQLNKSTAKRSPSITHRGVLYLAYLPKCKKDLEISNYLHA